MRPLRMFWDQISTARHTGSRLIHLSSRDAHTDPTRHLYDIPRKSNVTYRQTHSKTQSRLISSSNVPLSQSCRPHIRKKHQQTLSLPPPIQSSQRTFTCSSVHRHNHLTPPKPGEERKITFIDKEGQSHTFDVADGDNLLDIAQDNDLDMEGACGGSCACSTCHVIVRDDEMYDKMEEPTDDENDMLDLAFSLSETSRLGCQVKMNKALDGLVVKLPSMTRNMQLSDFAEKEKKPEESSELQT